MDTKILIALMSGISAILAAFITGYLKNAAFKYKLNELKYEYGNKILETYLLKARDYTNSIYVPLAVSLSRMNFAFEKFRSTIPTTNENLNSLQTEICDFLKKVEELFSNGASAFLTTELDENLGRLNSFLSASLSAKVPRVNMTIKFSSLYSRYVLKGEMRGRLARVFKSTPLSLNLGLFGCVEYSANQVLSAPIGSKEFEEQFIVDSHNINVLIKEVTLGSAARR